MCLATLLIAANDLGYTTPNEDRIHHQQKLCIGSDGAPLIQFSKGRVLIQSVDGDEIQGNHRAPVSGDTLITGADGFVSIMLANGRYENVQPHSSVRLDSCQNDSSAFGNEVRLETPYLSAAIRG